MTHNNKNAVAKDKYRLSQSFYRIQKRLPLSQLIHLGNWNFKTYAFLLEGITVTFEEVTDDA